MKEEKKDDDDTDMITEESEIEQPEKKARLDETEEDKPVVDQNGIIEPQSEPMDDNEVQEVKVDVPIIEIADELKEINTEDSVVADPEIADAPVTDTEVMDTVVAKDEVVAEPEPKPVKESPSPTAKTTPTRGRGGRGRGVARRGRSSR